MNDTQKFDDLFKVYYPRLMVYASRFVDDENAEDIVQDVFLELWDKRDRIDAGEFIQSFLYRSTYTKCLNFIKHKQVVDGYGEKEYSILQTKLEYYSADGNETMQRIESEELQKSIQTAIDALPEKCREVFQMSYLYDMKNKEISNVMNVSLRTVEAHMYKALKNLREMLITVKMNFFLIFLFPFKEWL